MFTVFCRGEIEGESNCLKRTEANLVGGEARYSLAAWSVCVTRGDGNTEHGRLLCAVPLQRLKRTVLLHSHVTILPFLNSSISFSYPPFSYSPLFNHISFTLLPQLSLSFTTTSIFKEELISVSRIMQNTLNQLKIRDTHGSDCAACHKQRNQRFSYSMLAFFICSYSLLHNLSKAVFLHTFLLSYRRCFSVNL